jgi:hypothetical protein
MANIIYNYFLVKLPSKTADLNTQLSLTLVIFRVEPNMLKVCLNCDVEVEQRDELFMIKFNVFPDTE